MTADLPVAESWYRIDRLERSVVRFTEPHTHQLIRANAYLVKGRDRDLLVDAGLGIVSLREALVAARLLDKPVTAVATHAHYDHVGSLGEFEERLIHAAEAEALAEADDEGTLRASDFPVGFRAMCERIGLPLPELLIDALPRPDYSIEDYRVAPVAPTETLAEGDTVDLGDRRFRVLHLPGHSPGGIGLVEEATGILFSGDAVYDGPLLDEEIPGADIATYVETMRRLTELPVEVVYGGHDESFDRDRLRRIATDYVARRNSAG